MKKFALQAIILLLITALAFVLFNSNIQVSTLPFFPQETTVKQLQINGTKLKIEVVDTQAKRSKGLGGREALATDEGMLFVFPSISKYPFWMKGLSFPLDFIWIKGDKVVDLLPNVQPPTPDQPDASLPIYQPKEEVDKVLEVSVGTIERLNIKVGDIIEIK